MFPKLPASRLTSSVALFLLKEAARIEQAAWRAARRETRMTSQHGNGRLTTHVLDTTNGRPAARLRIVLSRLDARGPTVLLEAQTNLDGRCDAPLLAGETLVPGRYELVFHAGAYLRRTHGDLPEPPFLDEIPIRFGIADADAHYHVPLLISPYGYSTSRGS